MNLNAFDYAYTFTEIETPVPTKHIDSTTYFAECQRIGHVLGLDRLIKDTGNVNQPVVVCLSEYRTRGDFYGKINENKHRAALDHLIKATVQRFPKHQVIVKPHPRSNWDQAARDVATAAFPNVSMMSRTLFMIPMQILIAQLEPRAVVSIVSSAVDGVPAIEQFGSSLALRILTRDDDSDVAMHMRKLFAEKIRKSLLTDIDRS